MTRYFAPLAFNNMKTSLHTPLIASLVAALVVATVAIAQPPPRNPSDSGAGAGPIPSPGRPGSGYPSPLGRIVLPSPDAPPPPPPRIPRRGYHAPSDASDSTVASVQRVLKRRGYYAGPVDGEAGGGTARAIRAFRSANGLGFSTRIDGPLLRALGL